MSRDEYVAAAVAAVEGYVEATGEVDPGRVVRAAAYAEWRWECWARKEIPSL